MELDQLRMDSANRGKRGLHFIISSIIIWTLVLLVWMIPIGENLETRNLMTFCIITPLMPLSVLVSKVIKAEFSVKDNPLTKLGLLLSFNQFLYILIAMWVYPTVPDKMLMVLAIIFGAHLLPFGWLYKSKAYIAMSVIISFVALFVGVIFDPVILSLVMIGLETIFAIWLAIENKVNS